MGKTFFIADTHFGHDAIIRYENRPFANADEQDKILIENWNSVVTDEDEVFLVGDFSAYDKEKNTEIVNALKGHKILVMGNHDAEDPQYYLDCGIDEVYRFPVLFKGFFLVSHEPLYLNSNMPYANIYGHVHANPSYKDASGQSFCVSVERLNYTPIPMEGIGAAMAKARAAAGERSVKNK